MAGRTLIKHNIIGKRVFAVKIANAPANTMLLISNKNSPKAFEPCLGTELVRNGNISITAPDSKV